MDIFNRSRSLSSGCREGEVQRLLKLAHIKGLRHDAGSYLLLCLFFLSLVIIQDRHKLWAIDMHEVEINSKDQHSRR